MEAVRGYSVGNNRVLDTFAPAAPVISISTGNNIILFRIINILLFLLTATFSCPPLPSMATTQPTPQPPNPTTDSEETPPTTNQQTQEPTDPPTTDSTSGNTNGDIQATDSEGAAGTELRLPTTSETATDLPIPET